MSDRTSAPFRTGPPSPSPSSPFTSLKDITPTILPEQTPQTPTSPPLMSVSAPNNASTFASLQALPSQATSQPATLSSPPSSAPMSTQASQQPTAGVTNSFPTPASSVDPDHTDKSFGTRSSEPGAPSAAGASAATTQESDHRRTDHNRNSESAQAGTDVRDFANMSGDSTQQSHGDAMELDTEAPVQTNSSWPSLDSLQKDFSSAFHLCKSSHIATGPDPSVDLISLYGLGPVAKSVARNDHVTGEKINRLRKSYEGKLKGLGLAGRNKPVKHDPSTPGGLRQMTMWPEEEWQNQKVFGKEIKVTDMDSALHNLQMKAMKMEPGTVPNNDYWEDVLGHDKSAKNANTGEAPKKSSTPANVPRAMSQQNGTPLPVDSERGRPSRGRKRHYDDNSFVGYGEGFADDDDDSAFYSNGEGGGKKKRKKDHVARIPGPPERGGSYGVGMFGIGAR